MHALYPLADHQVEMARRQDEMMAAEKYRLASQCPDSNKADMNVVLRLANFLLLLVPFVKR